MLAHYGPQLINLFAAVLLLLAFAMLPSAGCCR